MILEELARLLHCAPTTFPPSHFPPTGLLFENFHEEDGDRQADISLVVVVGSDAFTNDVPSQPSFFICFIEGGLRPAVAGLDVALRNAPFWTNSFSE
jgi:hypothetical protein